MSNEIKQLAQTVAGKNPGPLQFHQAVTIAETELDLRRIREARAAMMQQMSSALSASAPSESSKILAQVGSDLIKIDRYERRALSRRKCAIRSLARSR
jgi:hypothetical protein